MSTGAGSRAWWRRVVLVASVSVGFAGWWLLHDPCDHPEIARRIREAAKGPPGSVLDLGQIAGFPWDSACIVPPYTRRDDVERQLGAKAPCFENSPSNSNDGTQWLAFVHRGQVVAHAEIGRELHSPERLLPREKARFRLEGDSFLWCGE